MAIGKRIETLRGGQSRRAFAEHIGIVENTLRNYEQGLSLPNSDVIAEICSALNVSAEWILFGTGPMRPGDETQDTGQAGEVEALRARVAALEAEIAMLKEVKSAKEETADAYKEMWGTVKDMLQTSLLKAGLDLPPPAPAAPKPDEPKPGTPEAGAPAPAAPKPAPSKK